MNITQKIYEDHHDLNRKPGFSILKNARGDFFRKKIGVGKKVLDLGCRDGALTSLFLDGNNVLGVDVDTNALARANQSGIKTKFMDIYGDWNEIAGEKFDVIVVGEVLEHLFFPDRILQKIREHLSPSGMCLGSVPNAFSLKNRMRYLIGTKKGTPLSDPTHVNQFSFKDLDQTLKKVFSNVEISGLGRYRKLATFSPNLFAFDLVFVART